MHISSLHVDNFRNFESLLIDPFPRNAVVVGENGAGKSNLIAALQLVLDPGLPRQARQLRESDVCQSSLSKTQLGDLEVRIEIELQGFDDLDGALSEFDGWIVSKEPLTARVTYVWRRERISLDENGVELPAVAKDFDWKIFGGSDEARDASRIVRELPITVVPALRDAARDLENWRTSPLATIIDMRPPSRAVIDAALESISLATDQIAADVTLEATGGRLKTRLNDMSGQHLDLDPTMGIAASRADHLVRSLRLYIDGQRTQSIADTSTGGANVVYLALLLERLALRTEDDDQLDFVLGVEEPEAHLHPALQRQLFGFLLREYSKLILTTHSPHIAATADLRSLVLLRSDAATSTTTAATVPTAQLSDQELSDLDRYLDVSRAEFLFAKAVILVEGIADVYALRGISARLGFDLDSWGVVIANVQGTDFQPYRTLFSPDGFNVPHVIVTDGDQTAGKGWLGYKRAAPLVGGETGEWIDECVTYLRMGGEGADHEAIVDAASAAGVFIGTYTLEVDLCALFGDELAAAIDDLLPDGATTKPLERVNTLRASDTEENRRSLLNAVDNVSKGRLGQRFASELEVLRDDHPLLVSTYEDLHKGTAGYLLGALERVASLVGHNPLFVL